MNKKDKIKLLLGQLENLEKKSDPAFSPANEDFDSLITRTINEETSKISVRLNDNDTVKLLKRINQDLIKIRKELDLKPIAESISSIKDSIGQQDEENSSKFKSLDKSVKSIQDDVETYYNRITDKMFQVEYSIDLLSKKDDGKGEISSINKELKDFKKTHSSIQSSIKDILGDISGFKKSKDDIRSDVVALEKRITDLIDDTSVKIGNLQRFGGGGANRKISINGTVVSTKYTDINFKGSGVTYSAADNNTTKEVDLTLTASGGSATWGDITGTLSDQTDLQTALDAKAPTASPTFTGTVTLPKTVEIQDTSADHQYLLAVSELTADRTITLPLLTGSDVFVFADFIQTLTNKRLTKRVVTAADATSITPNTDSADWTYQANTQATGTLTIGADAGTPTNCQPWGLKIKSTNVQTFSWNALYVGGTNPLPTATTGSSQIDYFTFIYDTVDSKWHFTGSATNL